MTTATEASQTHLWESRGYGKAPFRVVGLITLPATSVAEKNPAGYQNAMAEASQSAHGLGVSVGTCDVCGMGLTNNFVVESADRRRFVVGCDCVTKADDPRMMRQVKTEQQKVAAAKRKARREAERAAEWERTRPEREARQAEWDRLETARKAREAANAEANGWLIAILEEIPYGPGGFVEAMLGDLRRTAARDLSPRCLECLGAIYAKRAGRGGSAAYKAALDEFDQKVGN